MRRRGPAAPVGSCGRGPHGPRHRGEAARPVGVRGEGLVLPGRVHVCVHTHTLIHTYICTHTHERTHARAHAPVHTCTRTAHSCARTLVHTCTCTHTDTLTQVHVHACTHSHTYAHTHMHTCVHVYMQYTHSHMHMHTRIWVWLSKPQQGPTLGARRWRQAGPGAEAAAVTCRARCRGYHDEPLGRGLCEGRTWRGGRRRSLRHASQRRSSRPKATATATGKRRQPASRPPGLRCFSGTEMNSRPPKEGARQGGATGDGSTSRGHAPLSVKLPLTAEFAIRMDSHANL